MRIASLMYASTLLLAGCGSDESAPANGSVESLEANQSVAAEAANASGEAANGQVEAPAAGTDEKPAPESTLAPPAPAASAAPGACMVQGEEKLRLTPLRATGTEPFWGARIEGRCVTYNHPEDQKGTRIWTRYAPGPGGGIWSGALDGKTFELKTRSKSGCSDGMSDKNYPIAVELLVNGERRTGCAEPL